MSTRIETYLHQSLAGAGFAVLDSEIAATLRPDLWRGGNGGIEAGQDFSQAKSLLSGVPGVRRFAVRFEGVSKDIPVVARSSDYLAMRIEWVTGKNVLDVFELTENKPAVAPEPTKSRAESFEIDRFPQIKTAEPARTCSSCDHLTAGHACRKAKDTGLDHPPANVPHRCIEFKPQWNAMDMRTGRQIWPELVNQEATHAA